MAQIRTALPSLTVQEPQLGRRCLLTTGAGDLTPFVSRIDQNNKNNSYPAAAVVKVDRNGSLKGSYGSAFLPGVSNYYNTRPFVDAEPVAPTPSVSACLPPAVATVSEDFTIKNLPGRDGTRATNTMTPSRAVGAVPAVPCCWTAEATGATHRIRPEPVVRSTIPILVQLAGYSHSHSTTHQTKCSRSRLILRQQLSLHRPVW